ncbi:hypothetical protein [Clostridium sp. ZBS18]|uniref:hypothetical protein n=1 Tax=Clostridium sp. ZBS18 TaxID=2949967 RepID=UPI002079C179|nr:hypothetical protein [Clostridium sp. ZBS18]
MKKIDLLKNQWIEKVFYDQTGENKITNVIQIGRKYYIEHINKYGEYGSLLKDIERTIQIYEQRPVTKEFIKQLFIEELSKKFAIPQRCFNFIDDKHIRTSKKISMLTDILDKNNINYIINRIALNDAFGNYTNEIEIE